MTSTALVVAQKSVAYCTETIERKVQLEVAFLDFGARLMRIRDEKLYAGQWESFEEFCQELKGTSLTSASRLINIYRVFVQEYAIPEAKIAAAGGWTMLAEALPLIKTKSEALHWLHEATHTHRTDLRRTIKEAKTGKSMAKCKHKNTYTLRCCRDCGLREKVADENG